MQYIELNRVGPTAQLQPLLLASRETMCLKRGSFTRISSCYSVHTGREADPSPPSSAEVKIE